MATRIAKPEGAYHHGNLREALLRAALELLTEGDAAGLSLRAVARRAKVSSAAPYRHFESREALLAAIAAEGFRTLASRMRDGVASHPGDSLAAFRESGVAYVTFALEHPAHYAVMFSIDRAGQAGYPELSEAATESKAVLLEAIRNCQRDGSVPAGSPREIALAAWSAVHGLASLMAAGQVDASWIEGGDTEEVARRVLHAMLTGVAARA